jgi:hypothetical protein
MIQAPGFSAKVRRFNKCCCLPKLQFYWHHGRRRACLLPRLRDGLVKDIVSKRKTSTSRPLHKSAGPGRRMRRVLLCATLVQMLDNCDELVLAVLA